MRKQVSANGANIQGVSALGATPERLQSLDSFRFIAAFGVLIYHFEAFMIDFGHKPPFISQKFYLCADLFFILSGFVLAHIYRAPFPSWGEVRHFIEKRLARIYPLHLLTLFIALVLTIIRGKTIVEDMDTLLPNLFLIHAWGTTAGLTFNDPSWSISAEFLAYLLFPLFLIIRTRWGILTLAALAMGLALWMVLIRQKYGMRDFTEATFDYGALRALPSFMAGMCLEAFLRHKTFLKSGISWWLASAIAILPFIAMLLKMNDYLIIGLGILSIAALVLAERNPAGNIWHHPWFVALGDASYALYMLHFLFLLVMVPAVKKLLPLLPPAMAAWPIPLLFAALVIATILASLFSYRCFEMPLRRWFSPK